MPHKNDVPSRFKNSRSRAQRLVQELSQAGFESRMLKALIERALDAERAPRLRIRRR